MFDNRTSIGLPYSLSETHQYLHCRRPVDVHENSNRVSTYLVIEIRLRDARANG